MSESHDDGQPIVRVRAQVMTRDDSTGGWIPLGGGGLSNVAVRKKPEENEYIIHGKRISDNSVVISCILRKDFEYYKVMPTFRHWKTGEKKFGLTFQTSADARAFDKGVCIAIEELLDGHGHFKNWNGNVAETEDDVFMALDLPIDRDSMSSGSEATNPNPSQDPFHPHFHRIYFSRRCPRGSTGGNGSSNNGASGKNVGPGDGGPYMKESRSITSKISENSYIYSDKVLKESESYSSYVQFSRDRPHEYSYPVVVPDPKKYSLDDPLRESSIFPATKTLQLDPLNLQPPPRLPTKASTKQKRKRCYGKKTRCRDCNEIYSEDCNPRGACSAGPDRIRQGIDVVTCMSCARGMLYHCFDENEEVEPEPSHCQLRHSRCICRWIALSCLSILLPCLCLYLPFAGCHWAAKYCHICGARHHPS